MDTQSSVLECRTETNKSGTTQVSFICQKCYQPLKLHQTFERIDQDRGVYEDLVTPIYHSLSKDIQELSVNDDSKIVKKVYPRQPIRMTSTESGNGFTLLGESEPTSTENLSRQFTVTSELFDILSGNSEIDHPLCEECTDNLLDLMDQQLRITEDECRDYKGFLAELDNDNILSYEQSLDHEIQVLKEEENALVQQLESIENERVQTAEMIKRETKKSKDLQNEEAKYLKEYNEYKRQLLEYEDAQRSADNQLKYAKLQLDKLTKTNVFNATFHIWHSGHFGTINNFRLGRLPNIPVEWNEINAAWGQTVLLLHSLANKMNLKFERYRLVPYGNHSYVELIGDKTKELPLYGSGGIKFFWDTKFDQAMVAFLDCLQQFKEAVERGDTGFVLPYKMEKGKIEDTSNGSSYSIKTQFNSEEQWTKALKFMLTNLKWGLAWVSSQFTNK